MKAALNEVGIKKSIKENKSRKKLRVSLVFKVTALIVILIVLVSSVTNYTIYTLGYNALKEEIKDKLKMLAANAALVLDAEKLKTIKTSEDEGNETYLELQKRLQEVQKASENKLRYVYTIAKSEDGYIYIMDATPIEDEKYHSAVGEEFSVEDFPEALNGFNYPTVEKEPIVDEDFGTISQSGYAPIKDKDGNVVGIIGIDMDISTLKVEEAQMTKARITALVAALILALILGILFSKYLTEPILILTKGTRKIAEGDLDTVVTIARNDELGQLANSFNSMTQDLKASQETLKKYNLELEDKVAERTAELSKTNKEVKDILDNMSQAIFTIDEELKFNAQHSRYAFNIFGDVTFAERNILEVFFQDESQQKDKVNMQAWLQKVFANTDISWDNLEAIQPVKEIKIKSKNKKGQDVNKFIQIDFQRITENNNDKVKKAMVIVQDITEKKTLELEIEKKQQEYKDNIDQIVEIIKMDQELFEDFIKECKEQMTDFEPKLIELKDNKDNLELINNLFRIMHTIKGNSRIFNLERIAGEAHAIENIFSSIRKGETVMTDEILDDIFKKLDHFNVLFNETMDIYNKIVQGKNADSGKTRTDERQKTENEVIKVKVHELDKLTELIKNVDKMVVEDISKITDKDKMGLIEKMLKETETLLQVLRKIAIGKLFTRFPRMVRDLAIELGKKIKFITKGDDVDIDRNIFDKIADPMIHLIRNSLDHGIEMPEERIALGKPEEGTLKVSVSSTESELAIEIADDGKGLDVDKIKAKAVKNGLITPEVALNMAKEEAVNLIFAPGFSTSDKVSDISGRGVGMDVVKTFIEEKLNGKVVLETEKNLGLKVKLLIPQAS